MPNLSDSAFDGLFPFHVRFDASGTVSSLGSSLRRLAPQHASTTSWGELVKIRRPRRLELCDLPSRAMVDNLVVLEVVGTSLVLRGQITSLDDGETFHFLGSPWVNTREQMQSVGLRAGDFAKHDPTADTLTLLGTLQRSLEESRALRDELEVRQQSLEKARLEAEEANRAKSRFLAVMSHEIRTPMNGLGSMVDLLRETELSGEQRELTDTIVSCSDTLAALLNDILDVSKIEAGRLDLESIEFSPAELVREVASLYRGVATENDVDLAAWVPPDVPSRALGDPTRIRQVLSNLLGNAVKFTERGEIVVVARAVPAGADELSFQVTVRDTGRGIAEDAFESIFEPFTQESSSVTRRFGGTGLGLTICRQLARMMGGGVRLLESSPAGSTFQFDMLLGRAASATRRPPLRVGFAGTAAGRLAALAEELALEPVESAPDVLLADRPDELDPRPAAEVPALCLVGDGDAVDPRERPAVRAVERASTSAWIHALNAVLSASHGAATERAPELPRFEGLRLLVAEDVPTNRLIVRRLLERLGVEPAFAVDGGEALEKLESERFDLVLMDVAMPVMDGYEVTRRWRARETGARTPIVALTAHAMSDHRSEALESGMDDVLPKPIRLATLARALERWTRRAAA